MNEMIDWIKHQRELIGIHKEVIAQLNQTIAMFGALTPPYIQLDKKQRISEVNGIVKNTIKYLGQQRSPKVNELISKIHVVISIDGDNVLTPQLDQVYQQFNMLIDLLAISESDVQFNAPITILFMSAEPDDNVRFQSEFDDIVTQVQLHVKEKSLIFLLPSWNTNYEKLVTKLNHDQPNVLHYSGHSYKDGLHLVNNITYLTQVISKKYFADIFEGKESHLQLVILNSCFSAELAGIISKNGIYVLGMEGPIETDVAVEFAKHFYVGFSAQKAPINIVKAIKQGCLNFAVNFPEQKSSICLYKDGKNIDYEQI